LLLYDTRTHATREVTRNAIRMVPAPAGLTSGFSELTYLEKSGSGYELRAVSWDGEPRVLHASSRLRAPWLVSRHGDRWALGEHAGDSTVLYIARGTDPERRLVAIAGKIGELAWSPDGRTLAGTLSVPQSAGGVKYSVVFMGVSDEGEVTKSPWQVSTDVAWDLAWLADGRAVTVLEEQGNTNLTRVLRVPADPRAQPASLTPNEHGSFWGQSPSPDGRWVAIPVERQGASTLWSIDVDAAAKAWKAKREKP
jgi:Tol biopolymer transport system component